MPCSYGATILRPGARARVIAYATKATELTLRAQRKAKDLTQRGHRGKAQNTEEGGGVPSAGLRQRRRPPFAKSLRAGRMTMLIASSEKLRAQKGVAVPRCAIQQNSVSSDGWLGV